MIRFPKIFSRDRKLNYVLPLSFPQSKEKKKEKEKHDFSSKILPLPPIIRFPKNSLNSILLEIKNKEGKYKKNPPKIKKKKR